MMPTWLLSSAAAIVAWFKVVMTYMTIGIGLTIGAVTAFATSDAVSQQREKLQSWVTKKREAFEQKRQARKEAREAVLVGEVMDPEAVTAEDLERQRTERAARMRNKMTTVTATS